MEGLVSAVCLISDFQLFKSVLDIDRISIIFSHLALLRCYCTEILFLWLESRLKRWKILLENKFCYQRLTRSEWLRDREKQLKPGLHNQHFWSPRLLDVPDPFIDSSLSFITLHMLMRYFVGSSYCKLP